MIEHITVEHFKDFLAYCRELIQGLSDQRHIDTEALYEIRRLRQAVESLAPHGSMKLHFGDPTSSNSPNLQTREEPSMPGKETDMQTIPCSEMETDGQGNQVVLNPANVTWAIDDPTIAELQQNPDGSATFKALKPVAPAVNPRTAKITCTDNATNVVGEDSLEVDDSPTQPGKMVLNFGSAT